MDDRDVLLLDGGSGDLGERLHAGGGRVGVTSRAELERPSGSPSGDVLIVAFDAFAGPQAKDIAADLAHAEAALRPGGRLLVLHDYGRDDVSGLYGPRPEYGEWSRRDGPFLGTGFKIRVVHSWWTFDSLEEARDVLADTFGAAGTVVGADLTRPRLSYNVAVYHRSFGAP